MVILDANVILRYLLNDNEKMAETAEKCINEENVSVTVEVIAEVVYVLKGVYSLERRMIGDTLKDFLLLVDAEEKEVLNTALDAYSRQNLDFVDCVLYAYHIEKNCEVVTFDKKLQKFMKNADVLG